jgi:uncharacterized protein
MKIHWTPIADHKVTVADLTWVFGGGGIAIALLSAAAITASPYLKVDDVLSNISPTTIDLTFGVVAYGVFLVSLYGRLILVRRMSWRDCGFKRCEGNFLAMGILAALLWISVSAALYSAFGLWDISIALGRELFTPFMGTPLTLAVFCLLAGPVAAITEETLFRGLIYRWLRQRREIAVSAFVSAILFALVHPYLYASSVDMFLLFAFDLTALSILLALLYEISDSLWPSIIAHAGNNLLLLGVQAYLG